MLVGDKTKFVGIVLGVMFAALLISQQGSIFCGMMLRTTGLIADVSGADLWVMDRNVRYIDDVKPMVENNLYRVRGVRGVTWAVPLYKGTGRAKLTFTGRADGQHYEVIEQVVLLGLDDASLTGAPRRLFVGNYSDLRRPDAVIVDKVGLRKLFPNQGGETARTGDELKWFVGRELEMNDRRAVIVGICEATRTFQSNAVIYTTYSRAKSFTPQERKILSYVLAKTEHGESPRDVALRIRAQTGLRAETSDEFRWMTMEYYLRYTGIPLNFLTTTALGFLVGTAVAGQTFYNFTLESLKQFGALKAMGASNGRIVCMILYQALAVGFLGFGLGVGCSTLFGRSIRGTDLAFFTPWQLLPITAGAVLAICCFASILSIRRVIVLEPAVVFR